MNKNWEELISIMESAFNEDEGLPLEEKKKRFFERLASHYAGKCEYLARKMSQGLGDVADRVKMERIQELARAVDEWQLVHEIAEDLLKGSIDPDRAYERISSLPPTPREVALSAAEELELFGPNPNQ